MPWLRTMVKKPEVIFVVFALIFGGVFCFLIPPGAGFDEITHLARMWEMSGGSIIPNEKFSQGPYFPMAFTDVSYRNRFFYTPVESDYFQKHSDTRIDWNNFTNHITRSVYFPIFYLPQAFTVGLLARLLDAPVLLIYYLCRILELLGYILMAFLAIRRIPYGKPTLAFLALAPMALFQTGTISTDPYTNGISFLFIAWVVFLDQAERITWKQLGILLLITLLLFSAKINTVFLALLLLLLPIKKFPSKRAFGLFWAAVIALFGLVVIGWNLMVYSSFYMNVPGYGAFQQLGYVLTHPLQYLSIFWNDLGVHGKAYLLEWIGIYAYQVGKVPPVTYLLFGLGLALVWLFDVAKQPVPIKKRAFFIAAALIGFVYTITVMYLVNNRVGSPYIEGVQGRYFIIVAPLLFLGLVNTRPVLPARLPAALPVAAGALATLLAYTVGLYLSFYVPCGTSYYTPGLCYQPPYKNWDPNAQFSAPVTQEASLAQSFSAACGPIQSIRLWSQGKPQGTGQNTQITLRDASTGQALAENEIKNDLAPHQSWVEVTFPPIAAQVGQKFIIEVASSAQDAEDALSFGVTQRHEYFDGAFTINAEPVDYDLIFQYGCSVK